MAQARKKDAGERNGKEITPVPQRTSAPQKGTQRQDRGSDWGENRSHHCEANPPFFLYASSPRTKPELLANGTRCASASPRTRWAWAWPAADAASQQGGKHLHYLCQPQLQPRNTEQAGVEERQTDRWQKESTKE